MTCGKAVRAPGVAEHDLGHQLGGAVGRERAQRCVLRDGLVARHAVDRGGRGEDELANAAFHGDLDQGPGFDGVVEVVAQRIGHGFRHHDGRGEMDDGIDAAAADQVVHQVLIAGVALDEGRALRHGPGRTGRQIVEDHHLLRRRPEAPAPCGCRCSRPRRSQVRSCRHSFADFAELCVAVARDQAAAFLSRAGGRLLYAAGPAQSSDPRSRS